MIGPYAYFIVIRNKGLNYLFLHDLLNYKMNYFPEKVKLATVASMVARGNNLRD